MKKWKPERGEFYWFVMLGERAIPMLKLMRVDKTDKSLIRTNNCFKLRKDAVQMAKKIKELFKTRDK